MGSRAVPLRFDTLAGSKLARRILSGCCRALRCVPVSRCTACLLACNAADLALPFGCSCGRATSAAFCHGYRVPAYLAGDVRQTVHADHCDGFDQAWLNGRGELTAQCLPHQISFAGHALTSSTIFSVKHNYEIKDLQAIMKAKSQDISRRHYGTHRLHGA